MRFAGLETRQVLDGPGVGTDRMRVFEPDRARPVVSVDVLEQFVGRRFRMALERLEAMGVTGVRVVREGDGNIAPAIPGGVTIAVDARGRVIAATVNRETSGQSAGRTGADLTVDALKGLIGLDPAVARGRISDMADTAVVRVASPDGGVTLDYVPGRVTVWVGVDGKVSRVSVEGGADTGLSSGPRELIDPRAISRRELQDVLGKPADVVIAGLKDLAAITDLRVAGEDDGLSLDYVPGRVTVLTDETGRVVRVSVEAGADSGRVREAEPVAPIIDPTAILRLSREQLASVLGQPVVDATTILNAMAVPVAVRVVEPGAVVTTDFVEGRVTFRTDANGRVISAAIEGGVSVVQRDVSRRANAGGVSFSPAGLVSFQALGLTPEAVQALLSDLAAVGSVRGRAVEIGTPAGKIRLTFDEAGAIAAAAYAPRFARR